ncbi:hypothetical protein BB560_004596, partial [Smittium megazygosporum]
TRSFAQFSQDSGSRLLLILNFMKNKGILHTADEETPTRTPDFRSTKKKAHHLNPEDLDMYPIIPISEAINVKE